MVQVCGFFPVQACGFFPVQACGCGSVVVGDRREEPPQFTLHSLRYL